MSDPLFRVLLGGPLPAKSEQPPDRYERGLLSSYLEHADAALATVDGLLMAGDRPADRATLWRELARAAESLCKAVRISHDLRATRNCGVTTLVHGDGAKGVDGLPAGSPWLALLTPLTALDDATTATLEPPTYWSQLLRGLLHRAHRLPRPKGKPNARGPRPRRRW
jgi:hypothetical protein